MQEQQTKYMHNEHTTAQCTTN